MFVSVSSLYHTSIIFSEKALAYPSEPKQAPGIPNIYILLLLAYYSMELFKDIKALWLWTLVLRSQHLIFFATYEWAQ